MTLFVCMFKLKIRLDEMSAFDYVFRDPHRVVESSFGIATTYVTSA